MCFPPSSSSSSPSALYRSNTKKIKKLMMEALSEDQRVIEGILEGERMRMEESFRSAAAARRVREEKRALEDAAEDR